MNIFQTLRCVDSKTVCRFQSSFQESGAKLRILIGPIDCGASKSLKTISLLVDFMNFIGYYIFDIR